MYISPETWLSPHHVATPIHGGGRMDEALSRAGQGSSPAAFPYAITFFICFGHCSFHSLILFFPPFLPFLIISDAVSRASKTARHFEDEAQDLAAASLECKTEAVVSGGFQIRQPEDRLGTRFNPDTASKGSSSGMNSGFIQHKYRNRQKNNKEDLMFYNCRYTTGRQSDPRCSQTVNGNSRNM